MVWRGALRRPRLFPSPAFLDTRAVGPAMRRQRGGSGGDRALREKGKATRRRLGWRWDEARSMVRRLGRTRRKRARGPEVARKRKGGAPSEVARKQQRDGTETMHTSVEPSFAPGAKAYRAKA
ncbi:hypothetical protein E2562_020679 [Oryza meyeriana var. granulata]|uniref:Uncharacterized protein n=1 Tax=Oryza meyeriana var. granulata TaxID=110450 RepID=A0A6G1EB28_9ORYZ|nr:hypothetical protein E2562_020679 [Oryza meyeriana var. granulata]